MTPLTKPVTRRTSVLVQRREVIVTIAPCGSQSEARIGFRLAGTRRQVVARVSDLYTQAAWWQADRERAAKRQARRDGVPWRIARKKFTSQNSIA